MTLRVALGLTAAVGGVGLPAADAASALRGLAVGCPVSSPTARPVPGRPSFNYGSSRIAVSLPSRATFVAVSAGEPGGAFVQQDGWIRTKLGWWTARGAPRVSGRRIDRRVRPLRADVGLLSWESNGSFYPSLLYFPSTGCWRITATAGGAQLVAVVRVVRR